MMHARYAAQQNAAANPREIELRAFRYVNGLLAGATDTPGRVAALHKTHRLWSLLIADLAQPGNALPPDLKGRLLSLGLWAQKEADARMGDASSLEPLLALHRDMIAGLEAQRPAAAAPPTFVAGAA
ncbi:flagellar biosynthesis regulator FlaF [Roseomonas sp. AR75]|uniref:flagellar biosynthesis regulator FlaF n=1 Tax=Roseomonas sp. AR75 TaxID=2562311 RepID=UPI0010BFEE00|nr:flagellar biosynthesis regulator FlaF [Roseomonas sp. AR75]